MTITRMSDVELVGLIALVQRENLVMKDDLARHGEFSQNPRSDAWDALDAELRARGVIKPAEPVLGGGEPY